MENKEKTGYPSIDKPWLKHYSDDAIQAAIPKYTIYENLYRNNINHPDDIALIYFRRRITYRQLFENINKVERSFVAIGVREGDIVALCVANTPEAVYCFYALNKIGAISNMIDLRCSAEEIRSLYCEVNSKYAFILDACYDKMQRIIDSIEVENIVVMSPLQSLLPSFLCKSYKRDKVLNWNSFIMFGKNREAQTPSHFNSDSIAAILHTGETTGTPKGVSISNRSMVCVCTEYQISGMHMERGEKFLTLVPPFILNGLCTCLNLPLSLGVTSILIPKFEQSHFPDYLKAKPEHIIAAPSWWERLMYDKRMKKADLSFLITVATGGDGINIQSEKALNNFLQNHGSSAFLINGYGMTELGSSVCTGMHHVHTLGSIGIPLPKMTISIFDENGKEKKYNEQGEICVTGPSMMNGYCGIARDETSNIMVLHKDGKIWVHTGDIGHMNEDGFVFIDGRIKRVIICEGGFKVFPSIVEEVITSIKGVATCAVVAYKPNKNLTGQVPIAYIVAHPGGQLSIQNVEQVCQKKLSAHFVPVKYMLIDELPLTPVGKVDYRLLEKRAEKQYEEKSVVNKD